MYPYSYYSVTPCHTFLPLLLPSSLIPSLTCLTQSLIHSLPCLSHSQCHSFSLAHFSATHFLTHLRLCIILFHCLTHSLTHSPVSLTLLHSLPHLLLPCLTHSRGSLIYSLSHSLTNFPTSLIPASLTHSLIHSLLHPFLCFTHSLIHSTVSFTSLSHSRPDIHSVAILCLTLPASSLYQWMVWSHNSMTHWKLLSNSNSTITVIQSGCHRTYKISWNFMIRWAHDGITRASRSRIAFLRQSITFLFPSYCFHDVKKKVSLEVKTKNTRFYKMPSRWHYEGQNGYTKSTRKWTFAKSSGNFLACQRFCHRTRSSCLTLRNATRGQTMA